MLFTYGGGKKIMDKKFLLKAILFVLLLFAISGIFFVTGLFTVVTGTLAFLWAIAGEIQKTRTWGTLAALGMIATGFVLIAFVVVWSLPYQQKQ
jgi:signal transduction histidine kinase